MNNYDYRYYANESLKIMKEQRKQICNDTINCEVNIYSGLHTVIQSESDKILRNLYFELYILNWLDSHWNYMQNELNNHNEYTTIQKKEITLFFTKYLIVFLKDIKASGNVPLSMPVFLKSKIESLRNLIRYNSNWEKNLQEIKLLIKKQQEQFKMEISNYEKDKENLLWQF